MKHPLEENSSITRYIAYVQNVRTLTREEESEFAIRLRDHADTEAKRRLVEANLRYVVAIALSYRRYGLRLADLISEGNVGLMTALYKFDPTRGTRFVTYASHWIRAFMLDYVIRAWSIVGVGSGPLRSKVFFRLKREKAKILALTSDSQEVTEKLAARFGTTVERIGSLAQRLEARDVSLDAKAHEDGTSSLVDAVPSAMPSQEESFLAMERAGQLETKVATAMADLDPREQYIVRVRVMADDPDELSLAEIGRRLGVSRERARQIEARAKAKLKRRLEEQGQSIAEILHASEAA